MNQTYLGHICIEPNMPDSLLTKEFINLAVEFEIICPKCGPNHHKIKRNGFDRKIKSSPQKFYCHRCEKTFFAHTSWIFNVFTDLIVDQIIDDLFVRNLSPKAIKNNFNVSESFITKIRYLCFDLLKRKVDLVKKETKNLIKSETLGLPLHSAIWWDETFFRINGSKYCLIVIIDSQGKVIGYKFSKTRSEDDYLSILTPMLDSLPKNPIFICDGCPVYEGVVKRLNRDSYLIQHIHSHPWEEAKIHHFKFNKPENKIEQLTIQIPYDSFLKEKRVIGNAVKRTTKINAKNVFKKKRGRKKGQKDTKKRIKRESNKISFKNKVFKPRGRINMKKEGQKFSFNPTPGKKGWTVKKEKFNSNREIMLDPDITEIEQLLSITFDVMEGKSIQSNLIESKNNVIKHFLKGKGLKNVYQYDYLLGAHLLARQDLNECYWDIFDIDINFRSSLGFTHMLDFFIPEFDQIKIFQRRKS